jgi:hypothetical protein
MTASVRGAQLRGDLATFRERMRRGAYPSALQGRAVAYAGDRVRNGAGPTEIAAELGVRKLTASRWIEKAGAASPSPTASAVRGPALSLIPLVVQGQRVDVCPLSPPVRKGATRLRGRGPRRALLGCMC